MGQKLLREYYELCDGGVCQDLLTEDEKAFVVAGGMYLTGIIQRSDTVNGNGRVYPHNVLMREMKNYEKLVNERRALGVSIGISSRGMGSVSESQGNTVVEDDFQLICFDFVSEPSTPGAFMMKEAKEFQNKVFTKADRINRLLNEVLDDE